ncbi:MAG TPA: hypothetical protein PLQ82_09065 [Desulfobacteraceae bacterium]|nr:hypothetical protein [Desulfobacteraceae bacterium]
MNTRKLKYALVASALNLATGATQVTKGINMANFHHCRFLIDIGTMGVANSTLKAYSGAADAALTSALAFSYQYGGATSLWGSTGTSSDVLAAAVTVTAATGLEIVQATYPNYLLIVDVPGTIMDIANSENWLMLEFTDAGGATGLVSVFAVLEPRYAGDFTDTCFS